MRRYIAIVALLCASCAELPTAPAPGAAPVSSERHVALTYAINIPDPTTAQALITAHPIGVAISPVDAQAQYDFTAAYGGTPNVYAGRSAPAGTYFSAGIVTAPYAIASVASFHAYEWPDQYGQSPAGVIYDWLGRFVYTMVGSAAPVAPPVPPVTVP